MGREIKFRAWSPANKKYIRQIPMLDFWADNRLTLLDTVFKLNALEFLQYTGLKDKNNTEIYEGDILHHDAVDMTGVVCWSEGLYRYILEKDNEIIGDLCDYDFGPEVIGNIYETPELLEPSPELGEK